MTRERLYRLLKRVDAAHRIARAVPALTGPLRLASYLAYAGLEHALGRRHPHGRVVQQARGVQARQDRPRAPDRLAEQSIRVALGARILFFTVRGWYVHVGIEAILAKALELRGARPEFFLCGGRLEQCDFKPSSDPHVTVPLCWRCTGFATRLLDAFRLPCTYLRDLVPVTTQRTARERLARLDRSALLAFRYGDLPLGEWVRASVQRSLYRGDIGHDSFSEAVLRGYVQSAVEVAEACRALLERRRPDIVVLTNGLFFAERIMSEIARRAGVRIVTYERGIPPDSIYLDHDKPAVAFDVDDAWAAFREQPLTTEDSDRLDRYLAERWSGTGDPQVQQLWEHQETDRSRLVARLGLRPRRPLAVLFTNVLWDSAVYDQDLAFPHMFEWLAATVRVFAARPDADLVIRVHPAEVRLMMMESRDRVVDRIRAAFPALPANVRLVPPEDPASSYVLADLATAVLVYSSTIGLEAAVRGRPVVVASRPHYRGRGFTRDVTSADEYPHIVDTALATVSPDPIARELARRYAFLFFFRFMLPFPWIRDWPRAARRLTFETMEELAPGRDVNLDRICDGILHRRSFLSSS